MKYLITGGCGFIGFHLAQELIKRGEAVTIIDNFNDFYDPALKFERAALLKEATVYQADILDEARLDQIFAKHHFDKVIHLAAQPNVRLSSEKPGLYIKNNIVGTFNVFECCRRYKIKNTVFASSSSVYGRNQPPFNEEQEISDQLSIYAYTKRSNELLAKIYSDRYGLNMVGLRMFSAYGSYGRPDLAFYIFTEAALNNRPLNIYGTGEARRDFTHISDIVEAIILSANLEVRYEIINIGNSKPISMNELTDLITKHSEQTANKIYYPKHEADMDITFANIEKAKSLLNWTPQIKTEDGIKDLVNWHRIKKSS